MNELYKKAAEEVVNAVIAEFETVIGCSSGRRSDWINTTYEATTPIIKSTMIYMCVSSSVDEITQNIIFSTDIVCFGHQIETKKYKLIFNYLDVSDDEYNNLVGRIKARMIQDLDRFGD